jgi:hypothetical protein
MMSRTHGGYSRAARKRRKRAGELSHRMHHGDPYAAFCLLQRRRALAGIKKNGWAFKVRAMNAARLRKREDRIQAAAVFDERRRVKAEYGLTAATLALLRARYGSRPLAAYKSETQCRPVVPVHGARCPRCGWQYGSPSPHIIGVP